MNRRFVLFPFFFLVFVVLCTTSCVSKKYTKKGFEYEQMGFKTEAAEYYYQALLKNKDNIEAKLGLKRAGQAVLDEKLNVFNTAHNNNNNSQAVEAYLNAENYYKSLVNLGVELSFPNQYKQNYEEVKDIYLEEKYLQAIDLLNKKNFSESQKILETILTFNSSYRDSKSKLEIAICEPKYLNAIQLMESNKFRTAYSVMTEIQKTANSYKDIQSLKEECLEKGSIALIIPSGSASKSSNDVAQTFRSKLINSLQSLNNPFLKIVETNSNTVSSKQVMVLNYEITNFNYNEGKLEKTETPGWLKNVTTNSKTGEKKTEYSKVVYYVCKQNRSLDMELNYKINDKKTSEVLKSNAVTFSTSDAMNYATYSGNTSNLVSGSWKDKSKAYNSSQDVINDNYISNLILKNQLNAKKTIKDYNTLLQEAITKSVSAVSSDIQSFLSNE